MPLRLIEIFLPEGHIHEVEKLLEDRPPLGVWYDKISEKQIVTRILVDAEKTEELMDLLEKYFSVVDGFRVILLPVAASLPRSEPPEETKKEETPPPTAKIMAGRLSREELYTQISDTTRLSLAYFVLVVLSAIVAAIGIINNNVAVVIGAMVIAPLLGPNMALALATTLGDSTLARNALKANVAGILTALVFSTLLGVLLEVSPGVPEIASRTTIGLGDLVLALAAGSAGVLAFTTGAPTAIIGVMVAVALLPPIVTLGLLVGSGYFVLALGTLSLLLANLICINLAGVTTFWVQGIQPITWWEANKARRATFITIMSYTTLLVVLALIILFAKNIYKFL